ERVLKERIADIVADVEVSAVQTRKLELAGRGDVERLFEGGAGFRRRCEGAPAGATLQGEGAKLDGVSASGPVGRRSLFSKTLHTILDAAQITRLDVLSAIRRAGGQIEKKPGSKEVQEIQMTASRTTDAGLERINLLRELKVLGLASTRITDAGLL